MNEQRIRFYPYRDGTNMGPVMAAFNNPPEISLSSEEKDSVKQFEAILTNSLNLNADIAPLTGDKSVSGIGHKRKNVNTTPVYIVDFPEVYTALGTIDGDIKSAVLSADYSTISSSDAGKIERETAKIAQDTVVNSFESNNFETVEGIPNPERVVVVRNPQVLVEKARDLKDLKLYLKKLDKSLDIDNEVDRAKRVMITIHRRRVNQMIAALYPDMQAFKEQAGMSQRPEYLEMLNELSKYLKGTKVNDVSDILRWASRIDKFANGAGEMINGNYVQLSSEAIDLANQLSDSKNTKQTHDFEYKDVDPQKIKDTKISSDQMKKWAENTLSEWGILSEDEEYDSDRVGPAKDGKWQAVLHPKANTFAVDADQKIVKIPPGKERYIASVSPAGAVPVMDHEMTHVVQHENRAKMGISITASVGMDRSGTIAEGGGIMVEAKTQEKLFGQQRTINPDYLRAIEKKLEGGTYVDCVKAFYDSKMSGAPNNSKRESAELAADRVMRLFRNGGVTQSRLPFLSNSGPLEYLEQELVARQLRGTPLEIAFYYTRVNLDMLAELHKIGMLDLKNTWVPPVASIINRNEIDEILRH